MTWQNVKIFIFFNISYNFNIDLKRYRRTYIPTDGPTGITNYRNSSVVLKCLSCETKRIWGITLEKWEIDFIRAHCASETEKQFPINWPWVWGYLIVIHDFSQVKYRHKHSRIIYIGWRNCHEMRKWIYDLYYRMF